MKIGEVMALTGLTRKAIHYYEAEGLIQPLIDLENGYRIFSENEVETLRKISDLRKVGLSIEDIRGVLANPSSLPTQLERQLEAINREIGELGRVKQLLEECLHLVKIEEAKNDDMLNLLQEGLKRQHAEENDATIVRQLLQLFPGPYGRLIASHFAPFLGTNHDKDSWNQIVDFLDNADPVEFPEELRRIYDELSETDLEDLVNQHQQQIVNILSMSEEQLQKYAEEIHKVYQTRSEFLTEPVRSSISSLKTNLSDSGYYSSFVEGLKRLSPLYASYQRKMGRLLELIEKRLL